MNNQIKELTLSALILALTCVLSLIQIPLVPDMGLSLDFSYVALIIGRRYIGITKTMILCFIFPWFTILSTGTGSWPGAIFLFLQSLFVIMIDYIIMKDKITVSRILISVGFITLWSWLLNVFIIAPMWLTIWDQTWADYYNNFFEWGNAPLWTVVSIIFNPVKFMVVYVTIFFLLPKLQREEKSNII